MSNTPLITLIFGASFSMTMLMLRMHFKVILEALSYLVLVQVYTLLFKVYLSGWTEIVMSHNSKGPSPFQPIKTALESSSRQLSNARTFAHILTKMTF